MIRLWPLLLAGCAPQVERPSSACPCDLDFSAHPRHQALQAVVDDRVARGLPGMVVALRTPEGVWAGAAGFANLEDQVPMNVCHMHHLASVAKTWYAALALKLQEQGRLDLDDRLVDHLGPQLLDRVPNGERVTLRELMTHTSGIPDFNADVSYVTGEFNDPTRQNTPLDLVDAVRGERALGEPGEVYAYADTNYVLLALAIERITGDHLASLQAELLDPLALSSTWAYRRGPAEPSCMCNTYWEAGRDQLENVSDISAEYAIHDIGADGVAASPLDALSFVEALVRGELLSDESRAQMTSWAPLSEQEDGRAYGLGLARRQTDAGVLYGHTGGGLGTGAVMRASPDQEITFVAATNTGMFLPGPLGALFDETLWDDLAAAAGLTGAR